MITSKPLGRVACVLALAACVATPALAADSGFYLGVNVGQAKYDVTNEPSGLFVISNGPRLNDSDTGFSLSFGYRLNPYLGFELALSDFGGFQFAEEGFGRAIPPTATTANGAMLTIDGGVRGTSLSVVGTLPLDKFSLYAKAGAMYAETQIDVRIAQTFGTFPGSATIGTASSKTTEMTYAVGAGYTFDSVFISLEYQRIPKVGDEAKIGDEIDVDFISAGFQYRF